MKDTNKLLEKYFQEKQLKEDSQKLQERIALQTYRKPIFSWQRLVVPVAATILLIIGVSVWTSKQQQTAPVQLAQKEIIYEDDDLLIYIKE